MTREAGACQSPADGGLGEVQGLGDLLVGHVVDLSEHPDDAQLGPHGASRPASASIWALTSLDSAGSAVLFDVVSAMALAVSRLSAS